MKEKLPRFFLVLFVINALIDLYAVTFQNVVIECVVKPLIVPLLLGFYLSSVKKHNIIVVLALIFSWLGDVFLLKGDEPTFFTLGLASFLIAHILYIRLGNTFAIKKVDLRTKLMAVVPFAMFCTIFFLLVKNNLNELFYPVLVYSIVISLLGVVAFIAFLSRKSRATFLFLIGVLVFIVSDTFIGVRKFLMPHMIYKAITMGTYILAQYLICRAVIAKEKEHEN